MTTVRSLLLFVLAAVAQIGGRLWEGCREHRGLVDGCAVIRLGLSGSVATTQPACPRRYQMTNP